tara:strand:+ start:102 stop:503 length:402 start_codon:yes stop_codon:yes gene_type:complete
MFSKKADHINEDLGLSRSYHAADQEQYDEDGMDDSLNREQKQTSTGSPKKVQFDENELVRESKRKHKQTSAGVAHGRKNGPPDRGTGWSEAVVRINESLKTLEDEIDGYYDGGQSSRRDKALVEYCQTANEAA